MFLTVILNLLHFVDWSVLTVCLLSDIRLIHVRGLKCFRTELLKLICPNAKNETADSFEGPFCWRFERWSGALTMFSLPLCPPQGCTAHHMETNSHVWHHSVIWSVLTGSTFICMLRQHFKCQGTLICLHFIDNVKFLHFVYSIGLLTSKKRIIKMCLNGKFSNRTQKVC